MSISGEDTPDHTRRKILNLQLLGGFRSDVDGEELTIASRKAQAILAILALSPQGSKTREHLRGTLWSESPEERAQYSLRNIVWTLKTLFGKVDFDAFGTSRTELRLDPPQVSTDVHQIQSTLVSHEPHEQLCSNARIFETLLYGTEGLDQAYDEWLRFMREQLQKDAVRQLEDVLYASDEDDGTLLKVAKVLVDYDGLNEKACQRLIRCFHATGATANALTVYQTLWNLLDATYGEEPSATTQDLIVAIKSETVEQASVEPELLDPRMSREPRAAMRPRVFVSETDLSGIDQEWRHLIKGFRHDLVASLVRFREWLVIDMEGLSDEPDEELLSASSYRLSMDGRRHLDEIRVILTFKNINSGEFVWSENFERPIQQWTGLQNEIVRRIAIALNVRLSADRVGHLSASDDAPLEAYDQWLLGHELMLENTPDAWSRADTLFEDLVERYPKFARGYSGRAVIENTRHFTFPGIFSTGETRKNGLYLARRAVQLDPLDSRSQLCLGWSCAMNGQFKRAELAFELAHQNNENDPWAMVSSAVGLAFCDRKEQSVELSNRALAIDIYPSAAQWSYQAVVFFVNEDYGQCVEACELAEEEFPDTVAWHAAALMQMGAEQDARDRLNRFVEVVSERWAGDRKPDHRVIARWILGCYPFRDKSVWSRFRDSLEAAGLAMPQAAPPCDPCELG